ncbi:MAG TPA: DUF350 domain-containing protein [Chloroflexota bacterium]|nr:DUF350 domain-containing protein [Chloroflexota bacterium]
MDVWINDILYTTGMVLFGAAVALLLSVVSSMLILQESWPSIRRQVVHDNSGSYGVVTGALFAAVCALVGVANRQSIMPIWDPTLTERVTFMLSWVIYGQIVSFVLLYVVNWLLFGLTPARLGEELRRDHNTSVAAVSGLTYLGVSLLVVFRIF